MSSIIKSIVFALVCLSFFVVMTGCGKITGSDNPFTITSSTQLLPLAESLASQFRNEYKIPVSVKGALGREASLLEQNLTDVLISNEAFSEQEQKSRQFVQKVVAFDKTVIVCNPQNEIEKLTQDDLRKIYTGEVKNWSQLGGKNLPMQVLSREAGSAIRRSFEKHFLDLSRNRTNNVALNALIVNSNPEMRSAVASIPGSIGYLSIGSLNPSLRELKIYESEKGALLESPLLKIYLIQRKSDSKSQLKSFTNFIESSQLAKNTIHEEGYLLPSETSQVAQGDN